MSHSGKHRKKEDAKHASRSNVFQRLGDDQPVRKYEQQIGKLVVCTEDLVSAIVNCADDRNVFFDKYYDHKSKHDKTDEPILKHKFENTKKKNKLKSSSKDVLQIKEKSKKHEYIDEIPRHSSKVRREFDEHNKDFTRDHQHHSRSKADEARGHKRKVSRSLSRSSSPTSPPRQIKHVTKRQRYQSPSPEPMYRPKDQERGRSRERRGKKQYDPHLDVQPHPDVAKQSRSHHSLSKKHGEKPVSSHDSWSHKDQRKEEVIYKKQATDKKKHYQLAREDRYSDDSFSKESKRSSQTDDLSEVSYGHEAHYHRQQDYDKVQKKHKQQKKEKTMGYSGDEIIQRAHQVQKKHDRTRPIEEKPKKKKLIERRDERSTSSHHTEFSSNEDVAKAVLSKKKHKEYYQQPRSPSRSITPDYHSRKLSAKHTKHLQSPESDSMSDHGAKKKTKMKKKKKHRMTEDDFEDQRFPPMRNQRLEEEDVESGKMKKKVKKKRSRDQERDTRSKSESEERIVKKQRMSNRELEPVYKEPIFESRKEKKREARMEKKVPPVMRRSPGFRDLTPPPAREKVPPARRVLSPKRSDSRHRQRSPVHHLPPPPVSRNSHSSHERDSYKPRDDRREVRKDSFIQERGLERRKVEDVRGEHRPTNEERRIREKESSRGAHVAERQVYGRKSDVFAEKQLSFEDMKNLQLLKEHLNAEKRKPLRRSEQDYAKRDRPPAILERRIDPPPSRGERTKSNWKLPVVDHPPKQSDYRDRKLPPMKAERVQRVREIRKPSPYNDPPRTRRVPPMEWQKSTKSSSSRERNISKERWPPARKPIDDIISDDRYKDGKTRSISRDRNHFSSERNTPTISETSGTYREVRKSGDQHSNRDLRLEVTIHDSGASVDYDKTKRKSRPSPARVVAYDHQRTHDRASQHSMLSHSRSASNPKRADLPKRPPGRPENLHRQKAHESNVRHLSHDRPRSREYLVRRDGSSRRGTEPKPALRDKMSAINRDRSRASSTSRSSTRSPRRQRRHTPLAPRSGRADRKLSRGRPEKDSRHPYNKQKRNKEKKAEPSSPSTKREKESKSEAADVLEVDWTGLEAPEKEKEEIDPGSVLSRFTPANVLLRMGVSSNLLPDEVLRKVVKKCGEARGPQTPSLVLDQGLGALNRSEAERRSSWLSNFTDKSRGARMTSFSDARYRQRILGIDGDLRIPTHTPYIINARTYSASIKHYLTKTANKIPIEVQ